MKYSTPLAKVQLCEYENQTLVAFVATSRLSANCPVARQDFSLLATAHDCETGSLTYYFSKAEPSTSQVSRYALVPGSGEELAAARNMQASFTGRQIPRDRLHLGKVLGEGEFGLVTKAELTEDDGQIVPCAVKTLKRK